MGLTSKNEQRNIRKEAKRQGKRLKAIREKFIEKK